MLTESGDLHLHVLEVSETLFRLSDCLEELGHEFLPVLPLGIGEHWSRASLVGFRQGTPLEDDILQTLWNRQHKLFPHRVVGNEQEPSAM